MGPDTVPDGVFWLSTVGYSVVAAAVLPYERHRVCLLNWKRRYDCESRSHSEQFE